LTSESELSELSESLLEDDSLDALDDRVTRLAGAGVGAFFFAVAFFCALPPAAVFFFWGVNLGGLGDRLALAAAADVEGLRLPASESLLSLKMFLEAEAPSAVVPLFLALPFWPLLLEALETPWTALGVSPGRGVAAAEFVPGLGVLAADEAADDAVLARLDAAPALACLALAENLDREKFPKSESSLSPLSVCPCAPAAGFMAVADDLGVGFGAADFLGATLPFLWPAEDDVALALAADFLPFFLPASESEADEALRFLAAVVEFFLAPVLALALALVGASEAAEDAELALRLRLELRPDCCDPEESESSLEESLSSSPSELLSSSSLELDEPELDPLLDDEEPEEELPEPEEEAEEEARLGGIFEPALEKPSHGYQGQEG